MALMIFSFIILTIGAFTSFTDIRSKKIYNQHLTIGAIGGLAAVVYTGVWAHENILFHCINGLIAFLAGAFFYKIGVWKGGDAKLFMLYAFLMPALTHGPTLFFSAVNLFACSFIFAMIIMMPILIKDVISNRGVIAKKFWEKRNAWFTGILISVIFSWIMFPLFHLTKFTSNPTLILTFSFLIFLKGYKDARKIEAAAVKSKLLVVSSNGKKILDELINHDVLEDFPPTGVRLFTNIASKKDTVREIAKDDFDKIWMILQEAKEGNAKQHFIADFFKNNFILLCAGILFGFLMRLRFFPNSLSWPILTLTILNIGLFSGLSACLQITFDCLEKYKDRIPFAPLLFIGCGLCYTPFLTWFMQHWYR
jgi:Flp pilus assembly protein protease CpaA